MYTTDLLEPTSPDERSLGRVKRHFVNTEVQLGNLEWREISRYEISLKAARNSRGVPLLEDIPVVGLAFRPLPQAKKSIQKNIIIGQATVYPTVEDLFSLRSPAAAGLPVDELSKNLEDIRKEQLRLSGTASDLLESKVKAALPVFRTASASADEGDGQHLALPVPIQRLSYESSATENAVSADRFANPIKPSGSAPAYVTSPRPAGN